MILATRSHEICAGHRVVGHEGKCKHLHGHNYLFELTLAADELDSVGRVIDFSVIKSILCEWLEDNWDHKMLLWSKDPAARSLFDLGLYIRGVAFNPTAENLAKCFCEDVAPGLLLGTGAVLVKVKLWETSKCSVTYTTKEYDEGTVRFGRRNLEQTENSPA